METVERDYSPRGVKFYYVYKALAHPEWNHYVTPFTLDERLMHVAEAKRTLGSRIEWLCDGMSNALKEALGNAPNAELVIGPDGRVVRRRGWSDPDALRADLEELVGPVEHPTREADLDMKPLPPPGKAARGVVPRPKVPSGLRPLVIEPHTPSEKLPFYVKLRAEAAPEVLSGGAGTLYLGFHLDPLYHVHWNNKAEPLRWSIDPPEGVALAPAAARAPLVEVAADADPREFLVEVEGARADTPLELAVRYYACDDANTFCVPVEQSYTIHFETDRHGGWVFRNRPDPAEIVSRMMAHDADGDGELSLDEAPDFARPMFSRADRDGNGRLSRAELEAALKSMMGR